MEKSSIIEKGEGSGGLTEEPAERLFPSKKQGNSRNG